LKGFGFGAKKENIQVKYGNLIAEVLSADPRSLEVN
jgi:hypothetical protein